MNSDVDDGCHNTRIDGCICAKPMLVASALHPYCHAHAHHETEADAEKWRSVARMFADPTASVRDVYDSVAIEAGVTRQQSGVHAVSVKEV